MKPLDVSVPLFPYDRWGGVEAMVSAARRADELGFYALTFPDHVIMNVRPGAPTVSDVWYDNFVLAAHLAAFTRRLRLLFNVMVVPYRPPVQLAKTLSSLDVVSGGRLIVGVGAGWLRGEFRTLGIPFAERGARTDESLRAMKVLWTEKEPRFEGRFTAFRDIVFAPRCVQQPHVPIWVGGSGPVPLRRAVELGDGWAPMVGSDDELRAGVARVREGLAARGRVADGYRFSFGFEAGPPDPVRSQAVSHAAHAERPPPRPFISAQQAIDRAGALGEIGFDHLTVSFGWETPTEYLERLEWVAAEVLPALR